MITSDITDRAARTLFDTTKVRWIAAELRSFVEDAERAIVFFRPDANAINASVQLVGGTRQTLPVGGVRFLRAVRNMGANGLVPGKAIRECSRVALDSEQPDWHYASPDAVVEHYIFDNVDPKHFYVFPCVSGTTGAPSNTYIEMIYSANPAPITDEGQTLTLDDQYINPILDFVLWRAYSKDAQYAGNMARAQSHMAAFGSALDINMKNSFFAAMAQAATPTPAAAAQANGNG
jgi:hypothetical protein